MLFPVFSIFSDDVWNIRKYSKLKVLALYFNRKYNHKGFAICTCDAKMRKGIELHGNIVTLLQQQIWYKNEDQLRLKDHLCQEVTFLDHQALFSL